MKSLYKITVRGPGEVVLGLNANIAVTTGPTREFYVIGSPMAKRPAIERALQELYGEGEFWPPTITAEEIEVLEVADVATL